MSAFENDEYRSSPPTGKSLLEYDIIWRNTRQRIVELIFSKSFLPFKHYLLALFFYNVAKEIP